MIATLTHPELKLAKRLQTVVGGPPLVYIAAPYTRPDPVQNTHTVIKIADALLDAGFTPLVPHLTLAWHLVSPKPYLAWLEYDRHLLARCDALLRIPGVSHGADQECAFAEELGIPVIRSASPDATACVNALTVRWRAPELGECDNCGRRSLFCRCSPGEG